MKIKMFDDLGIFRALFSHPGILPSTDYSNPADRPGMTSQPWQDFMEGFRQNALAPPLLGLCWANLFQV